MTHSLRRTDLSGKDQLWATVPRRLRMRDNPEAGGSGLLEGLCATLGLGLDAVRADIFRLYDDLFVETCDPALIPLIGQLVGAEVDPELPIDRRRYLVKSAIHWARRRGTAAQLEALAWISTGFRARLLEPENAAPLAPTVDARLLAPRSATILGPAIQPGAATLRIADWQPERRLTLELEVTANRHADELFELMIGIEEWQVQRMRQVPPGRGLAGTGHGDEGDGQVQSKSASASWSLGRLRRNEQWHGRRQLTRRRDVDEDSC